MKANPDPQRAEDRELARTIGGRDPLGTKKLLDAHYASMYRFAFHLSRRSEDSEDIVQQSLVRVLLSIGRYDGRSPLRSWLLAVVYREFLKWRRRKLWLPLPAERVAIDASFNAVVEAESLLAALAGLPQEQKATFLLYHVEEQSIAHIAAALNIPEGTVKSRLYAARQRLRALLGEETNYVIEPCEA